MIAFDDFPVVYFALGYVLATFIALLACWNRIKYQDIFFLLLSGALVLFMRLPVLVFNQEINPDESQMIAHALTLKQFPIYWQSVDGTTIGPLDNYLLIVPSFLGLPFDYTSARLMGLLCVLGSLVFFYWSLKNFFGTTIARLGLLLPLFLVAFAQDVDFVHYSSEQLPVLLLNASLWLLSKIYLSPNNLKNLFVLGFVLGLSPFAKIQVVPQAAVIGVFVLFFVYQAPLFWKKTGVFIAGGLFFPLLAIFWAAIYGVLADFWDFYVLGNLIYAGGSSVLDAIVRIPAFFAKSPDFLLFLTGLGLVGLMAVAVHFLKSNTFPKVDLKITTFTTLWLMASIYAATKSGNDFVHYLNFCIYPFGLLGALFANKIIAQPKLTSVVGLFVFLPFGFSFGYKTLKHAPLNKYISTTNHQVPQSGVTQLILKHAKAGEQLVVWGWMCKYHVEAQMPQGAAETHFERCIYPHPMREKYYQGLLEDLKTNHPKIFVDAVGPNSLWLNDRATQSHEVFPALNNFIKNNYTFVGEVEHTRVYVHL